MKEYQEINDHVFEGEAASPGLSLVEVRRAEAIRAALKAVKTPECRLTVDHLRNAVLDTSSRKPTRRLPWGWMGGGLGVTVAAGILALIQPKSPVDTLGQDLGTPTSIVASKSEEPGDVVGAAVEAEASAPVVTKPSVAEPAVAKPRRTIRRKAKPASKEPRREETLIAKHEARQDPATETTTREQSDEMAEPAVAVAKPADAVVIVVQPSPGHGKAIEVGLGQDVLFGG
ncbi:MAG: hypothetical protein AB7F50_10170 [Fimbriimonadaceae bacterium]